MPTLFFAYLAAAMAVNLAAAAVLFRCQAREVALLRTRHPAEWERLGRPGAVFRGHRMPTSFEWRDHRVLGDAELDEACAAFRRSAYCVVGLALATMLGLYLF